RAHERAPAAALDHGVRPATARDARVEAPAVPPGRGGGLAAGLRARCGRGGGPARAGGEGRRSCGSLTRGLIYAPQFGKRAPRAPHPPPLPLVEERSRV